MVGSSADAHLGLSRILWGFLVLKMESNNNDACKEESLLVNHIDPTILHLHWFIKSFLNICWTHYCAVGSREVMGGALKEQRLKPHPRISGHPKLSSTRPSQAARAERHGPGRKGGDCVFLVFRKLGAVFRAAAACCTVLALLPSWSPQFFALMSFLNPKHRCRFWGLESKLFSQKWQGWPRT